MCSKNVYILEKMRIWRKRVRRTDNTIEERIIHQEEIIELRYIKASEKIERAIILQIHIGIA
jgi:hypothetical protein